VGCQCGGYGCATECPQLDSRLMNRPRTHCPAAHTPMTKVPKEKMPIEKSPAEDTPAKNSPADTTPVLNTPAESQPDVVPKALFAMGGINTPVASKTMSGTQMMRWMMIGRVMSGPLLLHWQRSCDVSRVHEPLHSPSPSPRQAKCLRLPRAGLGESRSWRDRRCLLTTHLPGA
jgi:hypothetical protein